MEKTSSTDKDLRKQAEGNEKGGEKGGRWQSYCAQHGPIGEGSQIWLDELEKQHMESIPGIHTIRRFFEDEP